MDTLVETAAAEPEDGPDADPLAAPPVSHVVPGADVRAAVAEALRRTGLDDERPAGLDAPWRAAGLAAAVDRWP